ncbi:MAG: dTDP-4-dehydrorhamnose reductase [Actinobacteria bacterium]|nr:dTDP-4-dehydrorhamnose reductase [Actinomycetota bacterium]
MKIIVTGASGQLGCDLTKVLESEHNLFLFDIDLDVTDAKKVLKTAKEISPDVVIHSAAYTDVDGCESNQDIAYNVNAIGAQNVAIACNEINAAMVYVSTDFIFDGAKKEPYIEFDNPNPLSVYGCSKLAGEYFVSHLLNKYYICRTAWLYGKNGKNFVKTILKLADEKDELKVVNDQFGSPTYSFDLAQKIGELVKENAYGIYHTTNSGSCSWFEFARKILEFGGKDNVKISPISSDELDRPAKRPFYSVLRNYCLELKKFSPMRSYEEALRDYFGK